MGLFSRKSSSPSYAHEQREDQQSADRARRNAAECRNNGGTVDGIGAEGWTLLANSYQSAADSYGVSTSGGADTVSQQLRMP